MAEVIHTRCCIAGGGPAGMVAGFLLARAGVDVVVLEKHRDFLRDFRGDTVHASTLEVLYELGILDEFLKRPHQEVRELTGKVGKDTITLADFTHLPTHCRFIALMPQWDFLDFIKNHAERYPAFHLRMEAEVAELIEENGVIVGTRAKTPSGPLDVRAALTIGADGRHSVVRKLAGLTVIDLGAPMDVFWMRISRRPDDGAQTFGHIEPGRILVMIQRDTYWQCAYVIPKGEAERIKQKGIAAFREEIAQLEPAVRDRVHELQDWDKDISLLTVSIDRLARWHRPGLLCIGDAAHSMSPIAGVGINLAIQDAVATANILGETLLQKTPNESELQAVQERRRFPTQATQQLQIFIQNKVIRRVLHSSKPVSAPWFFKLLQSWPYLRRFPARIVGIGFRPEHIRDKRSNS